MADMEGSFNDRVEKGTYAGDGAWADWFRICSVGGCPETVRARLRAEIESAMFARLARFGLSRADVGSDDPVAFFDSYFKLKGSREKGKPLKLYFASRIRVERLRMIDFVCGTLFGARSGRVHDIVIDWISSLKGWKARVVRGADGGRRLVWEQTGENETVAETPIDRDPAAEIDVESIRRETRALLVRLAGKTGVEKSQVALLLYVTALDVALTEEIVLGTLGVGKSMAYRLRDKVMEALRKGMKNTEGADDPLFGRLLLEACEEALPAEVRTAWGGDNGV